MFNMTRYADERLQFDGNKLSIKGDARTVADLVTSAKLSGTLYVRESDYCGCCDPILREVAVARDGELFGTEPEAQEKGPFQPRMRDRNWAARQQTFIPDGPWRRVAKKEAVRGQRQLGKLLIMEALAELR